METRQKEQDQGGNKLGQEETTITCEENAHGSFSNV